MPNHFHLMIHIVSPEIRLVNDDYKFKTRTINTTLGILLRSYTNALQNQEGFTGSLFQQHTKAICLTDPKGITSAYLNTIFGTRINYIPAEKQYPQVCFDYIHQNPVNSGLTRKAEVWDFSSAKDYAGLRNGSLIAKKVAEEFGLVYNISK